MGIFSVYKPEVSVITNKEVHVAPQSGNDTSGTGAAVAPFATIGAALAKIDNTGCTLILHAGTYPENVTWSALNVDIVGKPVKSGQVNLTGSWNFQHASASVRVTGVTWGGALTHSGAGGLYVYDSSASNSFSKTGSGYFEANRCDFQVTALNLTGSGYTNFFGGKVAMLYVNNALAVVTVKNSENCYYPQANAGTLSIFDSICFASTPTGFAVLGTVNSTVQFRNSIALTPAGALAALSLAGSYSVEASSFAETGNVFGTNLETTSISDSVTAVGQLTGSSLSVPWVQAKKYKLDAVVEKNGSFYKSNAAIPANTAFAEGTTGSTWKPLKEKVATVSLVSASGSWVCPPGVTAVKATVIGAGGGGGSGLQGSGGGAGGVAIGVYAVEPGVAYSYSVAGYSPRDTNGGTTTITFGANTLTANGGKAGTGTGNTSGSTAPGGLGGTGTGGNVLNVTGGSGARSLNFFYSTLTPVVYLQTSGDGANSIYGNGGRATGLNVGGDGGNATGYGAGGAGCNAYGGGTKSGGYGTAGLIILEYVQ